MTQSIVSFHDSDNFLVLAWLFFLRVTVQFLFIFQVHCLNDDHIYYNTFHKHDHESTSNAVDSFNLRLIKNALTS